MSEASAFERSEYYYSPKMNSLIEVEKSFEFTAVIRPFPQKNNEYSVISVPSVNGCCIGWHLKFDGYDKESAVQAAKAIDERLRTQNSPVKEEKRQRAEDEEDIIIAKSR